MGLGASSDGLEDVQGLTVWHETGGLGDAFSRLQLVTGQHPDLDAGVSEGLQSGAYLKKG